MHTHKVPCYAFLCAIAFGTCPALAEGPNLGTPIDPADIAAWAISVFPDGTGLPAGGGTSAQGAKIFDENCSACHGDNGKGGGIAPALVTNTPIRGIDETTVTIANFWPYATTLFDYIRRAMPWQQPRSLSDNDVYALTAYILAQNKLIAESDIINAQTLPKVQMPNRNGFIVRFPDRM
jgi:S-disulfanyl-L-cysteine oxidoreductase SoxD